MPRPSRKLITKAHTQSEVSGVIVSSGGDRVYDYPPPRMFCIKTAADPVVAAGRRGSAYRRRINLSAQRWCHVAGCRMTCRPRWRRIEHGRRTPMSLYGSIRCWSRQEPLARLSRELPDAVDKYTPQGRLPTEADFRARKLANIKNKAPPADMDADTDQRESVNTC